MGQALKSYFYADPAIHCYARIAWGGKQVHVALTPKTNLHHDNAGWIFIAEGTIRTSRVALSLLDAQTITARFVQEKVVKLNNANEHTVVFDLNDDDPCVNAVVFEMITTNEDQTTKNKVVTLKRDVNGWYI